MVDWSGGNEQRAVPVRQLPPAMCTLMEERGLTPRWQPCDDHARQDQRLPFL